MSTGGTNYARDETSREERGCVNQELSLFHRSQQLLQSENRELMGENIYVVDKAAAASDYHLPTSNLPPELRLESSSRIQRLDQPYNTVTVLGTTQQQQQQQEIQFQGLVGSGGGGASRFYPGGSSSINQIQYQQGFLGIHPNPNIEMGDSSSRNVRMKMTLEDNSQLPYGELQLGTWYNPPPAANQPTANPNPRAIRNSVYDPIYEAMGLPVDPHLRMFLAKRNQGNKGW